MTEDPRSTDPTRLYHDALTAQLGERVTNLNRRQTDLEAEMRSGFRQMEASFSSFADETRRAIAGVSSSISERNKPQWQALGVALTFATVLGGLAYMPIREATGDLKSSVSTLSEKMVTRQEMDWRQARGAEDRARMEDVISTMRADLQRQLDQLSANSSSVYSARDIILDLRQRIDRVERSAPSQP